MSKLTWSPQQEAALRKVSRWKQSKSQPYFILAGYAGTGKTTLAKHFASDVSGNVYFAAYTGKAAHNLRKTGIREATTIHSLIYLPKDRSPQKLDDLRAREAKLLREVPVPSAKLAKVAKAIALEQANLRRPDFYLNSDSPLCEASLLIVDEYSMIDKQMGRDLLSFGCPILALGDPGQLPPVQGTPYFTCEPDVVLTDIHRQAADNPIIRLSRDVREGRGLQLGTYGASRVVSMTSLSDKQLEQIMMEADQILVGMNKTRREYNKHVRHLLGRDGDMPVAGDRLVCLRNNNKEGLLNGQMWTVDHVTEKDLLRIRMTCEDGGKMTTLVHRDHFLGKGEALDPQKRKQANEFDFGYALTTHKSQGSQWDNVVVYDEWRGKDKICWLYTAITRAAETVTVIR